MCLIKRKHLQTFFCNFCTWSHVFTAFLLARSGKTGETSFVEKYATNFRMSAVLLFVITLDKRKSTMQILKFNA